MVSIPGMFGIVIVAWLWPLLLRAPQLFSLSPADSENLVIGCAFQEIGASVNKNCVINSYAMLNDRRYPDLDTSPTQLSREITACFLKLKRIHPRTGATFNPMTDGMPAIFIDDVKSCKKQVMSNYGVNVVMSILPIKEPFSFLATASVIETLREHRSRYGGSPFRGDCPKDGPFTILITWTNPDGSQGGHSVMCEITEEDYCLETGSVRITCYEHPSQGGGVSTLTINSGGYVSPGGSGSNPSNPGGYIPIGAHVGSYTQ